MRFTRVFVVLLLNFFLGASSIIAQEVVSEKRNTDTQKRIGWLEKKAVKITSSNINKKKFKDLMPLKEKIGDARIVLLGEQTHGHGTTHRMKSRLIRFLHEEMGFNVLAWESSLPGCRAVDEAFLKSDAPLLDMVDLGIFQIFGRSAHNKPLFEYIRKIRKDSNPLIQAGFDLA